MPPTVTNGVEVDSYAHFLAATQTFLQTSQRNNRMLVAAKGRNVAYDGTNQAMFREAGALTRPTLSRPRMEGYSIATDRESTKSRATNVEQVLELSRMP